MDHYKRNWEENEEIIGLKQQLGQSFATMDFLRSQINPHFLFNALNTLYGTALLEKANRTAQGVQQLGDMMRFMLQENNQDQIPLSREIEYLENYISLQKLRTNQLAGVEIVTELEKDEGNILIAPMLLIPFVENAFKHGISLTTPSHIYIELERTGNSLLFTVINSVRNRLDGDREKNKSGIGLENVRQRLQLLYAGRHSLVITENDKEFVAKLALQLN